MKKLLLVCSVAAISLSSVQGGAEYSKDVTPPPCPKWYADREWNLNIWGAYAFTDNDYPNFENSILSAGLGFIDPNARAYDRYLEADHAWGGGIDAKYFFCRYFGLGIEGFAVEATRSTAT